MSEAQVVDRAAVARDGTVYFGSGGGIGAASDPEPECGETLDDARAISDVLAATPT